MADYLLYTPPYSTYSPRDLITLKAGPPPILHMPPFQAQPSILRERANTIAEDLGFLLRRYDAVVDERMRLKLFPAVCILSR